MTIAAEVEALGMLAEGELTLDEFTAARRALSKIFPAGRRKASPLPCPICLETMQGSWRDAQWPENYYLCPEHGEWVPDFERGSGVLTLRRPG